MGNILFASLLTSMAMGTAVAGTPRPEHLRVIVYDQADLRPRELDTALQSLAKILRHGSVEVELVIGEADADESSFLRYTNIVSKEQEHRAGCSARRDIALRILANAPSNAPASVLAMALPFAKQGLNVQVYANRVAWAAESHNLTRADLLGPAMAHEIGHVLLRSSSHDAAGLMAGIWTSHEYTSIAAGCLFFSANEAGKLRETITGGGCPPVMLASR